MKIKKYQNPSGTLTPEREAEIRAEQQAALNELWEKRNAYAKQEEQERKQQLKEEIKRVTAEHAAKTAHLDNGSSATDWYYALQDDPQKRAEWDRGAKLTTLAGLGAIATPYLLYGMGSMGGAIYRGLSNPITRTAVQQAGTKAALSTLAGEAVDRLSYDTRDYIDNSSIGNTKLNRYAIRPTLSMLPIVLNTDNVVERRLAGSVAKIDGWEDGMSMFDLANGNELTKHITNAVNGDSAMSKIKNNIHRTDKKDQMFIDQMNDAISVFGSDFLAEVVPSKPEYFEDFFPDIRDRAKQAFEREITSGQGLIANGILARTSGAEIAERGLAKQQGFGNNGIILARSMPQEELINVGTGIGERGGDKILYTMFSDPGIVDKYLIAPRGTTLKDMGVRKRSYLNAYSSIEGARQNFETVLQKAIARKDRETAVRAARGLIWTSQRLPSTMQHHNILSTLGQTYEALPETVKAFEESSRSISSEFMQRLENSAKQLEVSGGKSEIMSGDVPLFGEGVTKEYKLPVIVKTKDGYEPILEHGDFKRETRGVYPILMYDGADIMTGATIEKPFGAHAGPMYEQLSKMNSHAANGFRHRLMLDRPDDYLTAAGTPDKYAEYANGMASGVFHFSGDSTAGSGTLPSLSIIKPSEGFFKNMTPKYRMDGKFTVVPGLKLGGDVPKILK